MEASGETRGVPCGLAPHTCSRERTTQCVGVSGSRLQQAVSSQRQVLCPRPRSAVHHLEVRPLAWGGTSFLPGPRLPPSWRSSCEAGCEVWRLCPASPFLCTASSAGPFALRFCQFGEGLGRSQNPSCLWALKLPMRPKPRCSLPGPQHLPPDPGEGRETLVKLHGPRRG